LGLLVIVCSQVIFLIGCLGAEFFLQGFSLLVFLAGLTLFIWGWPTLWEASFVLLLLLLAIPLPTIVFNAVALPLQLIASSWAEFILRLLQVPVFRDGNLLQLDQMMLNVTEACSGIRSLASLVTAGVVVAYFLPARWWMRAVFVLSTIPIALAANAFRVAGTGLLGEFFGERWATGFLHLFSGWVVFVLAFCVLCGEWAAFQRLSRPHRSAPGVSL
jgi:exosortase